MAIALETKANTSAPDADYPFGNIKDNTGSNNGTAVNKINHADFHQFFAKMFFESGITYNALPDNETNGYQYWLALIEAIHNKANFYIDITGTETVNAGISVASKRVYNFADGTTMVQVNGTFASNIANGAILVDNLPLPFGGTHAEYVYLFDSGSGGTNTLAKAILINNGSIGQIKALENYVAATYGSIQFTIYYKRNAA